MAYADFDDARMILPDTVAEYPTAITQHQEFARMYVDSKLAGIYDLPFDSATLYALGVPVQIKWIAALLIAYRIWLELTVVEGLTDATAGGRWKQEADDLLDCIQSGNCKLTNSDGTIATAASGGSAPRFFPADVTTLDEDNEPYFHRDQAYEW